MKKYSNSWNKSEANLLSSNLVKNDYGLKTSDEVKNSNSICSSTLSLHIEAYENMFETSTDLFDGTKEKLKQNKNGLIKHKKQIFANLTTPVIKTSFEFSRQQESTDQTKMPKISQYKASQQLLNPNQRVYYSRSGGSMNDIIPVLRDRNVQSSIKNLAAYSIVILLVPLGSMFLLKYYLFESLLGYSTSDSSTYSAVAAVILVHVVLIFWLFAAFNDGKPKKPESKKD
uniref:Vacuolar ATPase assembly integral membrane protein VMA21 homolog n=1 Tax=Panagrolaimus sp. PS1159 TaxID=55785 RepID=A0AC35FLL4_9BILA